MRMKSLFLSGMLIFPLLFSFDNPEKRVHGTYSIINSEWGGHSLKLDNNGRFSKKMSGCVFDIETTGKWQTIKDTLYLEATERTDLRSHVTTKLDVYTVKFVIRKDTLFDYDEKTGTLVDREFALVRQ